ncbi:MAG: hypothetical protein ACRCWY_13450, partial [Cellulosilyticaceae bacterium]
DASYIEPYIEPLTSSADTTPVPEDQSPFVLQSNDDGIVMTLLSAINDANNLRIFATVTDTTGDRLGDTLEFANWGLSQGYGGNLSVVDYDTETKTAVLLITSLGNDHQGNATLTINNFATGRELLENLPEDNLSIVDHLIGHTPTIISQADVRKSGGGGDDLLYDTSRLLKYDELAIPFENTDKFSISNIGFVDGKLHIQARTLLNETSLDDGYYIDLKFVNATNESIYKSSARIDFVADRKYAYAEYSNEPHYAYAEMIFDTITTPEQLNGLTATIDYMKCPKITEGQWNFSFAIPEKVATVFDVAQTISLNGENVSTRTLSLSPLGATLQLATPLATDYKHKDTVYVTYHDGTRIPLTQSALHTYEGVSTLMLGGNAIEIDKVQSLQINDVNIPLIP